MASEGAKVQAYEINKKYGKEKKVHHERSTDS